MATIDTKSITKITPVLLCGGSGTRLWPLSRKTYPKQFVPLLGEETLFQASALRFSGKDAEIEFQKPMVLTNADFRYIVTEQLQAVGIDPGPILIEPEGRNTAPAILAAALHASANDPEAILLVAPSDHVIPDITAFHAAVAKGVVAVDNGQIVTFGITPTHLETGYGYLELSEEPNGEGHAIALKRFIEKPDAVRAKEMLALGTFKWNAGIFLFKAADILKSFAAFAPNMMNSVKSALAQAENDLGFIRLAAKPWRKADNISVDYAVMEHAPNLSVIPFDAFWSDLGGWDAVWRESNPDEKGVVAAIGATAIDCENTLLRADSKHIEIVGIGLKNIIAIAMDDAVLIADLNNAQDVKRAVSALKSKGAIQAMDFNRTDDVK